MRNRFIKTLFLVIIISISVFAQPDTSITFDPCPSSVWRVKYYPRITVDTLLIKGNNSFDRTPRLVDGFKIPITWISYPQLAQRIRFTGKVYIKGIIDEKGQLNTILSERSDNAIFDSVALAGIKIAKFLPALVKGKAVPSEVRVTINFSLDKRDIEIPLPTIHIKEISIRRTTCLGTCPAYKVSLHSDGSAIYEGYYNVTMKGTYTGHYSADILQKLEPMLPCIFDTTGTMRSPIIDASNIIISVTGDDGKTRGAFCSSGDRDRINVIANIIDQISTQIKWEKSKE